jgi:hypothetical protein
LGVYGTIAYRDKKVVGVFVRFHCAASFSKRGKEIFTPDKILLNLQH